MQINITKDTLVFAGTVSVPQNRDIERYVITATLAKTTDDIINHWDVSILFLKGDRVVDSYVRTFKRSAAYTTQQLRTQFLNTAKLYVPLAA